MATRRFKLAVVPCKGLPAADELTIDFRLLEQQKRWLERKAAAATGHEAGRVQGLLGLIDGLQDKAVACGVPEAVVYPTTGNPA